MVLVTDTPSRQISDLSDDEFEQEFLAKVEDRMALLRAELELFSEFRHRLIEHGRRRKAASDRGDA
jgi:hypothetical protein